MASGTERRLTAILSADVVGYSRLMAADEEQTLRTIVAYREQLGVLVRQHRGRVVDAPGDNLLAEFPSALDATRCALEIQRVVGARNDPVPDERRMTFRIGIHLGDVLVEEGRLYGDGVNIAARLESLAEAGGVCISAAVHEQVCTKLEAAYVDLGERAVKNIPAPVRVYRVEPRNAHESAAPARRAPRMRTALAAGAALLLLIAVGLWASWPRPLGLVLDLTGAGAPPVDPPLPDKPSIVVLPFENMSADPEQEYFADGITEDLTTELSRNGALFVISRSSAFTYKGRTVKVEDVARELGVRYVLEGSVRKAGGRVRITAQLIDATSGFHLWSERYDRKLAAMSERYDRKLAAIFAVQSELAEKIQTALQVEIRDAEIRRVRGIGTEDVDAYDALLRGLFHYGRFRREANLEARRWFARAL
ncbi:MAG: adenylate/guanylate cyclase domain-containing protein, partial [Deltaproteobacteria bacterium]|nr:adenylate/guanylate cyclase domain-containing protein [Deltaproteobacteria bacterium]